MVGGAAEDFAVALPVLEAMERLWLTSAAAARGSW
jgi:hypothetical protein